MFERIPSVQELLDSAPLKNVLHRANRAVVASGAKTFVDRLTRAAQAAAGDFEIPSATELAERIADWIKAESERGIRSVVNATGVVLAGDTAGCPASAAVVSQMAAVGDNYAAFDVDLATGKQVDRRAQVGALLAERAGAEAGLLTANLPTAVMLAATPAATRLFTRCFALALHVGDKELPVSQWLDCLPPGTPRAVGAINGVTLAEIRRAMEDEEDTAGMTGRDVTDGVFLWCPPASFELKGSAALPSLSEVAGLCREHNKLLVAVVSQATLVAADSVGLPADRQVSQVLAAGADLVVFAGDGLIGGPECGLIVGSEEAVALLRSHPLAEAFAPSAAVVAAFEAVLPYQKDSRTACEHIPACTLATAPTENLKLRAERIAGQLAGLPWIQAARAVAVPASLSQYRLSHEAMESWGVWLAAKDMNAEQLASRLRMLRPGILADASAETTAAVERAFAADAEPHDAATATAGVVLNLRSVLPRQDVVITELLEALQPSAAATNDGAEPSDMEAQDGG
jgi:L-seryl-tRNA(Ser) seleniumtransferase